MSAVGGISPKLKQLEKDCARLETYRLLSPQEFQDHRAAQEDTAYLLFTSCQAALDIGAALIEGLGLPEPHSETEVFTRLAEEEVLSEGCVSQLTAMHGLCDALSQQYEEIDPRWVYQTLQVNLDGINLFVVQVQVHLDK
jgi:uncharacterized protein YutE (UPF0331/DUF86 family)